MQGKIPELFSASPFRSFEKPPTEKKNMTSRNKKQAGSIVHNQEIEHGKETRSLQWNNHTAKLYANLIKNTQEIEWVYDICLISMTG